MLPVAVFPNEPQAQGGTPEGKLERKIGDNGAKSTKIGGCGGPLCGEENLLAELAFWLDSAPAITNTACELSVLLREILKGRFCRP